MYTYIIYKISDPHWRQHFLKWTLWQSGVRKGAFLLMTVTGHLGLRLSAMHDTNSPCFPPISLSVRGKHWNNHYSLLQDTVFTRHLIFMAPVSGIQWWHYPSQYNSYFIGKCKTTWVFFFPLLPNWSADLQCVHINKCSQACGTLSVATHKGLKNETSCSGCRALQWYLLPI